MTDVRTLPDILPTILSDWVNAFTEVLDLYTSGDLTEWQAGLFAGYMHAVRSAHADNLWRLHVPVGKRWVVNGTTSWASEGADHHYADVVWASVDGQSDIVRARAAAFQDGSYAGMTAAFNDFTTPAVAPVVAPTPAHALARIAAAEFLHDKARELKEFAAAITAAASDAGMSISAEAIQCAFVVGAVGEPDPLLFVRHAQCAINDAGGVRDTCGITSDDHEAFSHSGDILQWVDNHTGWQCPGEA